MTELLSAGRLLKNRPRRAPVRFYRRDLVLLAASVLFAMAGAMYLGAAGIAIGAALFFGMKMIAVKRQEAVERQVGEGLCIECGQRVVDGACPDCGGPDAGAASDAGPDAGPDAAPAGGPGPGASKPRSGPPQPARPDAGPDAAASGGASKPRSGPPQPASPDAGPDAAAPAAADAARV